MCASQIPVETWLIRSMDDATCADCTCSVKGYMSLFELPQARLQNSTKQYIFSRMVFDVCCLPLATDKDPQACIQRDLWIARAAVRRTKQDLKMSCDRNFSWSGLLSLLCKLAPTLLTCHIPMAGSAAIFVKRRSKPCASPGMEGQSLPAP